jgi:tetratricopeptide (TPR) repeat protein
MVMNNSILLLNANTLFLTGKYEQAINNYTMLTNSNQNNYSAIANRCSCYLKLEKYQDALNDAVKCVKQKSNNDKAWGKLGASLYGLNRLDESLASYNKAYNIEPLKIYEDMIGLIESEKVEREEKNNLLNIGLDLGLPNNGMFNNVLDNMLSNTELMGDIMTKLNDNNFRDKIINCNPLDMLQDKDMLNIMGKMMNNMMGNKK